MSSSPGWWVCAAAAAAAAAALGGCAASNPDDAPAPGTPGPDAGPEDAVVGLEIEASVTTTPWPALPIRGRGPSGGVVLIDAPRGREVLNLSNTGQFCHDVELVQGDNQIEFQPIDGDGNYGEIEIIEIRREGSPPDPDPEPEPGTPRLGDRTDGATLYDTVDTDTGFYDLSVELLAGEWAMLVDGNISTLAKFQGNWTYGFTDGEVIALELRDRLSVHGFRITVPDQGGETCGPGAFDIWLSDRVEPDIDLDGVTWVKVAAIGEDEASQSSTTYELPANFPGMMARYVAVRINETSCGNPFLLSNPASIAEIAVIAQQDDDGDAPSWDGAPSCASGN